MKKGVKFLLGIFFIISALYVPSFSFAEMQINTQENEIIVEVSPRNPEPYEETTISISSYATDLNKATITWQGNSGTLISGIGKTQYSFTAPGPNSSIIFDISIRPIGAVTIINKRVVVSPSEIEVLWEPIDGYTPPFYKGKALLAKEGMVKAVAIPTTDTIKSGSGNISYTWKNKGETVEEASGYNKDSYIFKNDIFSNRNEITVIASSVNDNYVAEKKIEISTYLPRVIFYKKSPTEGTLYNKALNNDTLFSDGEMTIVAEPFYLPIKDKWDSFMYTWKINGNTISTPSKKTELTIRPASKGGYASINVVFENINKLFQKVNGTLKLTL